MARSNVSPLSLPLTQNPAPHTAHGQRQIGLSQKGEHDDGDAGLLQKEPIDALGSSLSGRRRAEQDDIEPLARQPVEGRAQLADMNQIDQPVARVVEQIPHHGGAVGVALDQEGPNRSWISHLKLPPAQKSCTQSIGNAQIHRKKSGERPTRNHNMHSKDWSYNKRFRQSSSGPSKSATRLTVQGDLGG